MSEAEWFAEQIKNAQGNIAYWTSAVGNLQAEIKACTDTLARALELACDGDSKRIERCLRQAREEAADE